MENKIGATLSLTEKFAQTALKKLTDGKELDRIFYLKCKLGLESLFINLSKLVVVYAVAFLFQVMGLAFIFHLSYLSIRTFAYGTHAKSSVVCTIISCLMFVGIPYLLLHVFILSKFWLGLIGIINFVLLSLYAPAGTSKNKIRNEARRKKLRKKALIINSVVLCIGLFVPSLLISNLMILGSSLACLMITPMMYQLFDKGEK